MVSVGTEARAGAGCITTAGVAWGGGGVGLRWRRSTSLPGERHRCPSFNAVCRVPPTPTAPQQLRQSSYSHSGRRRLLRASIHVVAVAAPAAPTMRLYQADQMDEQQLQAATARPRVDFTSIQATVSKPGRL